ncbi:hypothetical protein ACJA25_01370 [Mycoplasmopsis hyopharyngis]|uniref:hypothetical protein n=1 Tax=Mycoplasmopsis hyopharyngis TaxID=29558 RepID=UPI003873120B
MDYFNYEEIYALPEQKPKKKKFFKGMLITLFTLFGASVAAASGTIIYYLYSKYGKKIEVISSSKQILNEQIRKSEAFLNSFDERNKNNKEVKEYMSILRNEIANAKILSEKIGFNEEYFIVAKNSLSRLVNSIRTMWESLKLSRDKFYDEVNYGKQNAEFETLINSPNSDENEQKLKADIQEFLTNYKNKSHSLVETREEYERNLNYFKYRTIDFKNNLNLINFKKIPKDNVLKSLNLATDLLQRIQNNEDIIKQNPSIVTFSYDKDKVQKIIEIKNSLESLFKNSDPKTGVFKIEKGTSKKMGLILEIADKASLDLLNYSNDSTNFFDLAHSSVQNIQKSLFYKSSLEKFGINLSEAGLNQDKITSTINDFQKVIGLYDMYPKALAVEKEVLNKLEARVELQLLYKNDLEEFKKNFLAKELEPKLLPEIVVNVLDSTDDKQIIDDLKNKISELKTEFETNASSLNNTTAAGFLAKFKDLISDASFEKLKKKHMYNNCSNLDKFVKANLQENFQSRISPSIYKYFYEKLDSSNNVFVNDYSYPKNVNVPVKKYEEYYKKAQDEFTDIIGQRKDINNKIDSLLVPYDLKIDFVDNNNKPIDIANIYPSQIEEKNVKVNDSDTNFIYKCTLLPNDIDGVLLINLKVEKKIDIGNGQFKNIEVLDQNIPVVKQGFKSQRDNPFKKAIIKAKNDGVMSELLTYSKFLDYKNKDDIENILKLKLLPILDIQNFDQKIKFVDISFLKTNEKKMQIIYQFVETLKTIDYSHENPITVTKDNLSPLYIEVIDFSQFIDTNVYNDIGDRTKIQLRDLIDAAIEYETSVMKEDKFNDLKKKLNDAIEEARKELFKPFSETTIEKLKEAYKKFFDIYENVKKEASKAI